MTASVSNKKADEPIGEVIHDRSAAIDLGSIFLICGWVYVVLKLGLMGLYAWRVRFVMDEMSLVSFFTRFSLGDFYDTVDPIKTVLHMVAYKAAVVLGGDAVGLLLASRIETWIMACFVVLVVYGVARNLQSGRSNALFAICVLLSYSTFMERAFRVRSETLSVLFAILALWFLTRSRRRTWVEHLAAGLCGGAAFLTTQKAVYFIIAFAVAYLCQLILDLRSRDRTLVSAALPGVGFAVGFLSSLLLYSLAFGGTDFAKVLRMIFLSPMEVALHADDHYVNLSRYFLQTLTRNYLAYGLCFAGLLMAVLRIRRLDENQRFALLTTGVVALFLLRHNQPWPYVFVFVIPFLAPWSSQVVALLAEDNRRQAIVHLVFLATFSLSFVRGVRYLEHHNLDQLAVVEKAESLLAPDERYSDGTGMVPSRDWAGEAWVWEAPTVHAFRAATASGDASHIETILADQPKLWIYSYRLRVLENLIGPYLKDAYERVSPNILLAGRRLSAPFEPTRFVARWGGRYRLFDRNGNPLAVPFSVNGAITSGEVDLAPGEYQLELEMVGAQEAYLLPADARLLQALPVRGGPVSLFGNVYEF